MSDRLLLEDNSSILTLEPPQPYRLGVKRAPVAPIVRKVPTLNPATPLGLTPYLRNGVLFHGGMARDLITPSRRTAPVVNGAGRVLSPWLGGVESISYTGSNYILMYPDAKMSPSALTYFVYARRRGTSANYSTIFGRYTDGTPSLSYDLECNAANGGQNQLKYNIGGDNGQIYSYTYNASDLTAPFTAALTWGGYGTVGQIYFNGSNVGQLNFGLAINAGMYYNGGALVLMSGVPGDFWAAFVIPRVLTSTEIAYLHANPMCMFSYESLPEPIFTPASSGNIILDSTIPTLSAPGVQGTTSTTTQPKVTLTF